MVFVLGLSASSVLLIVVRGDTLTEQTLLNVSGWFGLVVAGVACWPKDDIGEGLPTYDPTVAALNQYAIAAILVSATLVWLVGAFVLPDELVGTGWRVSPVATRVLKSLLPAVIAIGWIAFLADTTTVSEHAHGPLAVALFAMLGAVAFLRTTWGLGLLRKIGDQPIDGTVSDVKRSAAMSTDRYDWIYAAVAVGMVAIVFAAMFLTLAGGHPYLVIGVETALLALFAIFWGTQTREAWNER